MSKNKSELEYLTSGYVGKIYKNGNKIVKEIPVSKNTSQKLLSEIQTVKKLEKEPWSAKIYNVSMNSNKVRITMERFTKTFCEWAKEDHDFQEWHSFYRQLFNIIYVLHTKYKLIHGDLHCGNVMWRDGRVYLIDFGTVTKYMSKWERYDYEFFVLLYEDKYLVNNINLSYHLIENFGMTRDQTMALIKNKNKLKEFIKDNEIDLGSLRDTIVVPKNIRPFIRKLSYYYGKSAKYYLEKFFPTQFSLTMLSQLKPKVEEENTIVEDWRFVHGYNKVIDKYSIKCRMKCKLGNKSPENYVKETGSNYRTARKAVGECTNFNISRVIYLIKYLFPDNYSEIKWLDPSAGWGSRLMGAIALQISKYRGTDPNSCLEPVYKKIIGDLGNGGDYEVVRSGFEEYVVDDEYDLVFTSPPFFDFEVYSNNAEQSIKRYNTENKWVKGFLEPLIKKGKDALKKGGYLVLYIEPKGEQNYHHLFKDFKLLNMKYDDAELGRPFYIWKKE